MIKYPKSLPPDELDLLKERGEELLGLIRLMSLQANLNLHIDSSAPTWSFNVKTHIVTAPTDDLLHQDQSTFQSFHKHLLGFPVAFLSFFPF